MAPARARQRYPQRSRLQLLGLTGAKLKSKWGGQLHGEGPHRYLELAPLDGAEGPARIDINWAEDGATIQQIAFDLPYGAQPATRQAIITKLTAKWGPATAEDDGYGGTIYTFVDQPFIVVEADARAHAWTVLHGPGC